MDAHCLSSPPPICWARCWHLPVIHPSSHSVLTSVQDAVCLSVCCGDGETEAGEGRGGGQGSELAERGTLIRSGFSSSPQDRL